MTNTKAARIDLQMATRIMQEAQRALEEEQYYRTVRKCQEVVERGISQVTRYWEVCHR